MKLRKIFFWLLTIILVVIISSVAAGYFYISNKLEMVNYEARQNNIQSEDSGNSIGGKEDKDIINIMLIGVDNDYLPGMQERGNADGLVLVSINTNTKQIVMTSIMRDISIKIPDMYSTKVTLVYHYEGTDVLLDTLEYNFDIAIDKYVLVNYLNVIDIVDAMGGLEMEVTAAEIEGMETKIENLNTLTGDPPGTDVLTAEDAGIRLLNGKQVAALLRIRNTGNNDYGRTLRAREILTAMKDKAKEMSLSELNNLADVVMENVTTDMTTTDMLGLMIKAPAYMGYELISNRIPIEGSYSSDGSFLYIDYEANVKALHDLILNVQ